MFLFYLGREQQTLLCKTGVVLVVVSCLPGFGRLSDSLALWLDNTAPPPLPLFVVKVRDSKEDEKKHICSDKYKYK